MLIGRLLEITLLFQGLMQSVMFTDRGGSGDNQRCFRWGFLLDPPIELMLLLASPIWVFVPKCLSNLSKTIAVFRCTVEVHPEMHLVRMKDGLHLPATTHLLPVWLGILLSKSLYTLFHHQNPIQWLLVNTVFAQVLETLIQNKIRTSLWQGELI